MLYRLIKFYWLVSFQHTDQVLVLSFKNCHVICIYKEKNFFKGDCSQGFDKFSSFSIACFSNSSWKNFKHAQGEGSAHLKLLRQRAVPAHTRPPESASDNNRRGGGDLIFSFVAYLSITFVSPMSRSVILVRRGRMTSRCCLFSPIPISPILNQSAKKITLSILVIFQLNTVVSYLSFIAFVT